MFSVLHSALFGVNFTALKSPLKGAQNEPKMQWNKGELRLQHYVSINTDDENVDDDTEWKCCSIEMKLDSMEPLEKGHSSVTICLSICGFTPKINTKHSPPI